MLVPKPLILFIDAYDSFSSNIISLLETSLSCTVRTIKIDDTVLSTPELLHVELRNYAAVLCGPGPGHPANEQDVGIMSRIWRLCDEETLPVLGVCLGFQNLCLEFGGAVRRLRAPMHGIVRRVNHIGEAPGRDDSIFSEVGDVRATLYHSLCVDIGQDDIPPSKWHDQRWTTPTTAPELLPLAWVEAEPGWPDSEKILMAVKHKSKPFWGLQYHPESICTNIESRRVIKNWFKYAQRWNRDTRVHKVGMTGVVQGGLATKPSLLSQFESIRRLSSKFGYISAFDSRQPNTSHIDCDASLGSVYTSRTIDLPAGFSVASFVEQNRSMIGENIILDSSNAHVHSAGTVNVRGRYSIIAMDADPWKIEYTVGNNFLISIQRNQDEHGKPIRWKLLLEPYGGIWQFMSDYVNQKHITDGNDESPFWGGFMGYTTYEMGLEGINVDSGCRNPSRPDLCFAWIEQSIIIDHVKNKMYVQALERPNSSESWVKTMARKLALSFQAEVMSTQDTTPLEVLNATAITPKDHEYESKVSLCQDYIRSGDSYELCLTDQTLVTLPRVDRVMHSEINMPNPGAVIESQSSSSWSLYKTLRRRQPAPFGSYVRLGNMTFVSSSPERFLTWDDRTGKCSLRPMKGTVKKSPSVKTLEQANALLQIPKEQAENLMIVDLVRHDLHSVLGSGNVEVPRLMVVEEYASVFTMISVVEGYIPSPLHYLNSEITPYEIAKAHSTRYTGIDVLAASLPPGSMTGAPKKRSCEILRGIEGGKDRSMYSGVVGYMDVGGRGDFSVSIRCMFRWDDEDRDGKETWHIGAGGAVTALSTPVGEREEMVTKLGGTLGLFG
ncbi:aminodeoxychorismate synthase [Phlyctema vagabunda]|uniref:aminodeoxychorismate synthase n=1 Tax=Phlyctema vagabunda TaxID=108571 RepID=A0ABR4PV15_9HELO